jgi:hypothetical protein
VTSSGVAVVHDYYSSTQGNTPQRDTVRGSSDNVLKSAGEVLGDSTVIQWTRRVDTGDLQFDRSVSLTGKQDVIVAFHTSSKALTIHEPLPSRRTRPALQINWLEGTLQEPRDLLTYYHGLLSGLAWAVLVLLAQLLPRYCKSWGPPWFYLHIGMNLLALVMTLIGLALVIVATPSSFRQTETKTVAHVVMGLFVIIVGLSQPFLGWYSDAVYDPLRKKVPVFPDMLHWWIGRLVIVVALCNILLGLVILQPGASWFVAYTVWLFLFLVLLVLLEIRSRLQKKDQ